MQSGSFELAISETDSQAVVEVKARDAMNLRAAYFELHFDAAAFSPAQAQAASALAASGELLSLSLISEPGVLQHGQVLAGWPELDGFSGSGTVARVVFQKLSAAGASSMPGTARRISAVPGSNAAQHILALNRLPSVFSWFYMNPGDYDQNGLVGISDLTPLGANFNAEGPFAPGSARFLIDGNGDGLINIQDITPIGANFGNAIDAYRVYGSTAVQDYPAGNLTANGPGAELIGGVSFAAGSGGGNTRRQWSLVMQQPILGGRYWLRPLFAGMEGTPSALSAEYEGSWHSTTVLEHGANQLVNSTSLAQIAGRPALLTSLYTDDEPAYVYIAAEDVFGQSWAEPLPALTNFDFAGTSTKSLGEVDGRPAFTYHDALEATLYFSRALNAEGSGWSQPVAVNDDGGAGVMNRLLSLDGLPVAVYTRDNDQLWASLASDSTGQNWQEPELLRNSADPHRLAVTAGDSGVEVLTGNSFDSGIRHLRLTLEGGNLSASALTTPFPAQLGNGFGLMVGDVKGTPYALYALNSGQFVFSFAVDEAVSAWSNALSLNLPASGYSGTAEAYGAPWLCYFHDEAVLSSRAPASSTDWSQPQQIATGIDAFNAIDVDMTTAGVHPAALYFDRAERAVYFAVHY